MPNVRENRKITTTYKELEEVLKCSLCGEDNSLKVHGYENGFRVLGCASCGLWFVTPRPCESALRRMYTEYHSEGTEEAWGRYMWNNFRFIMQELSGRADRRSPKSVLDIGSACGHFLNFMSGEGWVVVGVELSERAASYARTMFGLERIIVSDFLNADFGHETFDAITMNFVLEHVRDPVAHVTKAFSLLKDKGILWITVPNLDFRKSFRLLRKCSIIVKVLKMCRLNSGAIDFFNVIDPPFHLFGFNRKTLIELLKTAGFRAQQVYITRPLIHENLFTRLVEYSLFVFAHMTRAVSFNRVYFSPHITVVGEKSVSN